MRTPPCRQSTRTPAGSCTQPWEDGGWGVSLDGLYSKNREIASSRQYVTANLGERVAQRKDNWPLGGRCDLTDKLLFEQPTHRTQAEQYGGLTKLRRLKQVSSARCVLPDETNEQKLEKI